MHYPLALFKEEVLSFLGKSLTKRYGTLQIDIEKILETPPENIADLAFPTFAIAKMVKENSRDIATNVADTPCTTSWIEKIEVSGNYINFFINKKKLIETTIHLITTLGDTYGHLPPKNNTIILEHTSTNPTGPLHIGRARNPIIGDTLARIFRAGGYKVNTQFYLDDMGKQVSILVWGIDNLTIPLDKKQKPDLSRVPFYQKAADMMKQNGQVEKDINTLIHRSETGDPELLSHMKSIYSEVVKGIIQSLNRLNISLDSFIEESRFIRDGSVTDIITKLSATPYYGTENNAIYLDLKDFGIHGRNTKFFLTRKDGTTLYAARDIAYHLWKGKHSDAMINILGEDHKLEAQQVAIALQLLQASLPTNVFYSFVSLPEGRMSTRKGQVVYLDDLMDEAVARAYKEVAKRRKLPKKTLRDIAEHVGAGAIRYNILKLQTEKPIVFRWEEALNFEGNSAPFIQYAYARCCSILQKTTLAGTGDITMLVHPSEHALIKLFARLPVVIEQSICHYNPSIVTEYAYQVAAALNQFYRDCRVLGSKKETERLQLISATRQVLKNTLYLLGITALETM